MRSSNLQGLVTMVPTLYEEEEDYAPLYLFRYMRSSILHYIPLHRNTLHYAILNCSVKRVCAQEAHKEYYRFKITFFELETSLPFLNRHIVTTGINELKFRDYFQPFWFSRSCVVVAYCNRACAVQMYKALSVRCQRYTKKKKDKKTIVLLCIVINNITLLSTVV